MSQPTHPLWQFSLTLYARPEVPPACLALQDRHGLDVNLVLACLWAAASGRGALDRPRVAALRQATGGWQAEVVAPLRTIRRRLKTGLVPDAFRSQVQATELAAERIEQELLADVLGPATGSTDRRGDVETTVAALFAVHDLDPSDEDRRLVAILVDGAFAVLGAA